jgi:hypothetical protein
LVANPLSHPCAHKHGINRKRYPLVGFTLAISLAVGNVTNAATDKQWTDLAEKSVRQVVKDPESVQFQSEMVRYEAGLKFPVMCGEVTGQTLTGLERGSSYSGFKKFVADPNTSKILILDPLDASGVGQRNADFETEWAHYCQPKDRPSVVANSTSSAPTNEADLKGVTPDNSTDVTNAYKSEVIRNPTLDRPALVAAAQLVRSYKLKDQFDSPPAQKALVGRSFTVELTPRESGFNSGCGFFASWSYDASKGELEVGATPGMVFASDTTPAGAFPNVQQTDHLNSVPFVCQRIAQSVAKANNAFGAVTNVQRSAEESLSFSTPDIIAGPNKPFWTTNVEGRGARDLAKAVRIRIRGVLGEWRPGQVIVCYIEKTEATFDLPFEVTTRDCMFKTEEIRFEIVDSRTQSVLHAWE